MSESLIDDIEANFINSQKLRKETDNLLKNFSGDWKHSSFGLFLMPPPGAQIAFISYGTSIGLGNTIRLLSHQVYLKNIAKKLSENKAICAVLVEYIGNENLEINSIKVYDKESK